VIPVEVLLHMEHAAYQQRYINGRQLGIPGVPPDKRKFVIDFVGDHL